MLTEWFYVGMYIGIVCTMMCLTYKQSGKINWDAALAGGTIIAILVNGSIFVIDQTFQHAPIFLAYGGTILASIAICFGGIKYHSIVSKRREK